MVNWNSNEISYSGSEEKKNNLNKDFPETISNVSDDTSKEIFSDKLELELENYRIDEWMSVEEKIEQWWEKEEVMYPIDKKWHQEDQKILLLKKEISDEAYVWEFIDNKEISKHFVGEQLFNWKAVEFLWIKDKLPSLEQINSILWEYVDHYSFMENFKYNSKDNTERNIKKFIVWLFSDTWKKDKYFLPGFFEYDWKNQPHFCRWDKVFSFWLKNGSYAWISENGGFNGSNNPDIGCSIRFIKP